MTNTNTQIAAVQASPAPAFNTTSAALMMDSHALERMHNFANLMATARSTVPQHFQGKPGDCLAVVMQATTWGMNPFAVAQKTFVINGVLGYEAQLVASVINSSSLLADRFKFEWFGPWEKIVGKFRMVESKTKKDDHGNPKKFMMPAWDLKDEDGLGVNVWATIKGETEPRVLTLLMTQARTRNSTLWTEDPKQQLAYLAQKRWARLYAPDVILGVYTPDEVQEFSIPVDMGHAEVMEPTASPDLISAAEAAASKGMAGYQEFWRNSSKEDRKLLAGEHERLKATASDVDKSRTVEQPAAQAAQAGNPAAPAVNYEDLKAKIENAQTLDALMVSADWIGEIADPEQREELTQRYLELAAKFGG
jgi:hypothetical protein